MKTEQGARHDDQVKALSRVEGQIRGVQRMISDGVYCIEIITQIQAAQAALDAVGRNILHKHLRECVTEAIKSGSARSAEEKVEQVISILKRRRQLS